MALVVDNIKQTIGGAGSKNTVVCDVDFDSVYPTGGEAFSPSLFGWDSFDNVMAMPHLGFVFDYDYSGELLLAYYADYNAIADSALIQVANGVNLSTLTNVKVLCIGA